MPEITIRILLDGKLVSTRQVTVRPSIEDPDFAARGDALRGAIQAGELTIAEALRATVEVVDSGDAAPGPQT